MTLIYASEELHDDHELVAEAINLNRNAWQFIHQSLRDNPDFMLKQVKLNGLDLEHVSIRLRSDRFLVLAAVKQNRLALEFASRELRDDYSLQVLAFAQGGGSLNEIPEIQKKRFAQLSHGQLQFKVRDAQKWLLAQTQSRRCN